MSQHNGHCAQKKSLAGAAYVPSFDKKEVSGSGENEVLCLAVNSSYKSFGFLPEIHLTLPPAMDVGTFN